MQDTGAGWQLAYGFEKTELKRASTPNSSSVFHLEWNGKPFYGGTKLVHALAAFPKWKLHLKSY